MKLDVVEARATAERADFLAEDDVDATPPVERDQMLRDLRRAQRGEQVDVAADERDGDAELRQRGGHFHPDEAAAHDDRITHASRRLADRRRVVERPQREHSWEPRALDWEPYGLGPRGQQRAAIAVAAPVGRYDRR